MLIIQLIGTFSYHYKFELNQEKKAKYWFIYSFTGIIFTNQFSHYIYNEIHDNINPCGMCILLCIIKTTGWYNKMEKNLKYINQDIISGKNLEENIPKAFQCLMNHYHTMAAVKLSMHYESFYEAFCDNENTWGKDVEGLISRMNEMLRDSVLTNKYGNDLVEAVKEADELRNEIMKKMNILTIYTDIFLIYEYVLNRVEYRFTEKPTEINEVEFEKEVLRYIFDSEDNYLINEKIKEMIGQLPVRMTKQKFFDLLKNSLHAYLGADITSFKTYLYMIRTSGLLLKGDEMQFSYPDLWEKKEFLSGLSYKDIKKEEYEKASNVLKAASLILDTETTVYLNMQEMVNEIYTLLVTTPYAGMAHFDMQNQETAVFSIIREINQSFINHKKEELPESLLEKFELLEGVQEELSEKITVLEDALYIVDKEHRKLCESLMLEKQLNVLLRSNKLLSNSLFIDFNEQYEDDKVKEDRLKLETDKLIQELSNVFSEHDKAVSRAIMANVLNKMPVFFQNHKEVMDYVRNSIDHCMDCYEKEACMTIIMSIISK